jgi:hypothetical protein
MKDVFADTWYFVALLGQDTVAQRRAIDATANRRDRLITSWWVLVELANFLSTPGRRPAFLATLDRLRGDPNVTIVPAEQFLLDQAVALYAQRPDKSWSLTDCTSFVIMRQHGLVEALTADHHFDQAGFHALLKPDAT